MLDSDESLEDIFKSCDVDIHTHKKTSVWKTIIANQMSYHDHLVQKM